MPDNISAPLPDEEVVTGEPYNALRQDLLYNHAHQGGGDGAPISHDDLTDVGDRTHAEIDADLATLEGKTVGYILAGRYDELTATTGVGWTSSQGTYNGSEGFIVTITFDPPLSGVPIVTVTSRPGDYDSHGNEGLDYVSMHHKYVYDESVNGFKMLDFRDYWASDGFDTAAVPRPIRFNFMAVTGW